MHPHFTRTCFSNNIIVGPLSKSKTVILKDVILKVQRSKSSNSVAIALPKQPLSLSQEQNATEDVSWMDKIIYSSYLQQFRPKAGYGYRMKEKALKNSLDAVERLAKSFASAPTSLKYLEEFEEIGNSNCRKEETLQSSSLHFPFKDVAPINTTTPYKSEADQLRHAGVDLAQILKRGKWEGEDLPITQQLNDWLADAENCDPSAPRSNVPCGGCGATLHCQDASTPGFMPKDRFTMFKKRLKGELCLRCLYLQDYNKALAVNVSAEDYPKVLKKIDNQFAMVLLIVDLTDFPCSIWPGIADIIGTKRPVFLVGNKVDLLPSDSPDYLKRIQDGLVKAAKSVGLASMKVKHVSLISARTGYGVENLITSIQHDWGISGDIYIMGCTNVGKSSLFNSLIKSDLCKCDVADTIQAATISQWPGTTLNLLKFPLLRPSKYRIAARLDRLSEDSRLQIKLNSERRRLLRATRDRQYSVPMDSVGRTFIGNVAAESIKDPVPISDPFVYTNHHPRNIPRVGEWDDQDYMLQGKWCYDTPGAVNENQSLDILTLPELNKTLPKSMLEPKTHFIPVGMSYFVGGLARIDYVQGEKPIRFTIFCSDQLPITIVRIEDAEFFYGKALGTPILNVPEGDDERLAKFPSLSPIETKLEGIGHRESCADIVLSSIGWISVTVGFNIEVVLKVYTPGGRGIFIRQPSILPFAVNQKGPRIRASLAYLPHRVVL